MRDQPNPLVYTFWKYDQFPYVLGDQGRLLPDGNFKAHGYGGATFQRKSLISIYPLELGHKMMVCIEAVKTEYHDAVQDLNSSYRQHFSAILPELENLKEFK